MSSSHPISEIKCKRTVRTSGIIKAPFHPLILSPTALRLDVCSRHIIYSSPGRPELLRGISKPSEDQSNPPQKKSESGFPANPTQKTKGYFIFSFPKTLAHVLHTLEIRLQKTGLRYLLCFFGGRGLLLKCHDEAKINPLVGTFVFLSFFVLSLSLHFNDVSPGLGSDTSPGFLHPSSFSSHQTSSVS